MNTITIQPSDRVHEIVHFGPETEFGGVDNVGRYHWAGPEPEAKTVAPRPIRRK